MLEFSRPIIPSPAIVINGTPIAKASQVVVAPPWESGYIDFSITFEMAFICLTQGSNTIDFRDISCF